MIHRFAPPNGYAVQLRPTALTINAGALCPPPERYHGPNWNELLGVSCNRLLDRGLREGTQKKKGEGECCHRQAPEHAQQNRFSKVQEFASYSRLVKCQASSAGKIKGTSGAKIGNAHLKWAFSEAAVLFLAKCPAT
jgi:hypothetical protein